MNRIVISAVSAIAGGTIVHHVDKIKILELEEEVKRLTSLVEKLKYDKDKLLKRDFLKKSFDTLKNNLEPDINNNGYLFNSDSSDSFDSFEELNQKNEPSSTDSSKEPLSAKESNSDSESNSESKSDNLFLDESFD